AGVSGELVMFAPADGGRDALTFGLAPDSYIWNDVPLAAGSVPAAGARDFVLLGSRLAETLEKKPGDTLSLFDRALPIAGITAYQAAVNRNAVLMPLADLQELAFRAGQVTVLQLLLDKGTSPQQAEAIGAEIAKLGNVS